MINLEIHMINLEVKEYKEIIKWNLRNKNNLKTN